MTLALTPAMLEAAYELLRTTPPFRGWNLPPADSVELVVASTKRLHGWHDTGTKWGKVEPRIAISTACAGQLSTLIECMAHEMIHLRQSLRRTFSHNIEHNAEFLRLSAQVCRWHGFDPKAF